MAPSPKKIEELKASTPPVAKPIAAAKKINCFAMDRPPKAGMIPVSTDQVKDGCFVLSWQPQQVTMLVSDAQQWYYFAAKIMKNDLAFSALFAIALLVVLVSIRDRW